MTKSILKSFMDGLKCCADVSPIVTYLDQLAKWAPQYQPDIDSLKLDLEYLQTLCTIGQQLANGETPTEPQTTAS